MAVSDAAKWERRIVVAMATVWAILLFVLIVEAKPWDPDAPLRNDFIAFWTGASLVRNGDGSALYAMQAQAAFQRDLHAEVLPDRNGTPGQGLIPYHNPPALALIMAPLAMLQFEWGYLLWLALGTAAFVVAVALPLRGHQFGARLALLMLTFPAVADTLIWGQMAGFLALAFSLALLAMGSNRPMLGGALLGLLWLKPQYGLLFPVVLLLKGRWCELGGMSVVAALLLSLSLAVDGLSGLQSYLELLRRIGGYYPPPESLVKEYAMVNWRSMLVHLFPGLPETTGSSLLLLLGGATLLVSLVAWRGEWDPSSPRFARQMLVSMLATLISVPHSHYHGLAMLLVPLALLLARAGFGGSLSIGWRWAMIAGYLLALLTWPIRDIAWLVAPFSLLAMLLLIMECRDVAIRIVEPIFGQAQG